MMACPWNTTPDGRWGFIAEGWNGGEEGDEVGPIWPLFQSSPANLYKGARGQGESELKRGEMGKKTETEGIPHHGNVFSRTFPRVE